MKIGLTLFVVILPIAGFCQKSKIKKIVATADKNICYDEKIPSGWVKITDFWDPTKCGKPRSYSDNVFQIRDASDMPIYTILEVCFDSPLPNGWELNSKKYDPTRCGHPKSKSDNVYIIVRKK
jgi:hypothetical protein